jgi:gluconolactonase
MPVDVRSEKVTKLVAEDVEPVELGSGIYVGEGEIWNPEGQFLLFADVMNAKRQRWDEAAGLRVAAEHTNTSIGMTLDGEGRLVVCETGSHCVTRMDPDGSGAGREVLASHYEGKQLNSPNDIVVSSDGSIYFTDPPFGRGGIMPGLDSEAELDFAGVFRIKPDGELQLVADDFEKCNGLAFSADESILYVNDSPRGHVRAFDVAADGTLVNDRVFAEGIHADDSRGHPDGMKVDEQDNVWVTGPYGIWILSPSGEHLGILQSPDGGGVPNFNFGGPDWTSVFIGTLHSIWRVEAKVAGHREAYMRGY